MIDAHIEQDDARFLCTCENIFKPHGSHGSTATKNNPSPGHSAVRSEGKKTMVALGHPGLPIGTWWIGRSLKKTMAALGHPAVRSENKKNLVTLGPSAIRSLSNTQRFDRMARSAMRSLYL